MKFRFLILLFLSGVALIITGAAFKIMHWPFGSIILTAGMLLQAFAIIMLIVKLISDKKTR